MSASHKSVCSKMVFLFLSKTNNVDDVDLDVMVHQGKTLEVAHEYKY